MNHPLHHFRVKCIYTNKKLVKLSILLSFSNEIHLVALLEVDKCGEEASVLCSEDTYCVQESDVTNADVTCQCKNGFDSAGDSSCNSESKSSLYSTQIIVDL